MTVTFSSLQTMAEPSALQSKINSFQVQDDTQVHLRHLTLQIAHNLRYQHAWTELRIHDTTEGSRPIISGLPPQRLYVHPDEQIEVLQKQKSEGKTGMPELAREREWVLPSHLKEKWSLRRFGEVFDAIVAIPPACEGKPIFKHEHGHGSAQLADEATNGDTDANEKDFDDDVPKWYKQWEVVEARRREDLPTEPSKAS